MCLIRTGKYIFTATRKGGPYHTATRKQPKRQIHFPPAAQHSRTKHTSSKQASKPVGHISPNTTSFAYPWKGKRESSRSKRNPIHPEGRKKQKKDSQFHASSTPPPLTDPLAYLLRLSLCLSLPSTHPSPMLLVACRPTKKPTLPTPISSLSPFILDGDGGPSF